MIETDGVRYTCSSVSTIGRRTHRPMRLAGPYPSNRRGLWRIGECASLAATWLAVPPILPFVQRNPQQAARPSRPGPTFRARPGFWPTASASVAGIDEAGRGPLAGPVVTAAVISLPSDFPDGLNDSKKLTAEDRERLFAEIVAKGWVGIASASADEIDRFNIRGATLIAMRRALHALPEAPCHVLVDGRDVPPALRCAGTAVISGDARQPQHRRRLDRRQGDPRPDHGARLPGL